MKKTKELIFSIIICLLLFSCSEKSKDLELNYDNVIKFNEKSIIDEYVKEWGLKKIKSSENYTTYSNTDNSIIIYTNDFHNTINFSGVEIMNFNDIRLKLSSNFTTKNTSDSISEIEVGLDSIYSINEFEINSKLLILSSGVVDSLVYYSFSMDK